MIDDSRLEREQLTAKETLDANVTLRAGAGTGKTTTLTARYLEILERELDAIEGHPEQEELAAALPQQILTTTFTERAAADLQESVREEVNARLTAAESDRRFTLWREVADGLEEGYIHTLHGLCHRILAEHAVGTARDPTVADTSPLARYGVTYDDIGPGFDVVEEADADALVGESVSAAVRANEETDAVQTLARRFDRSTIEAALEDLLSYNPRRTAFAWLDQVASYDDAATYAQDHIAQYFDVVRPDFDPAWIDEAVEAAVPAAVTIAANYEETRPDLHGHLCMWALDGLVDSVEERGLDGTTSLSDLSEQRQRDLAIEVVAALRSSSGGVHDGMLDAAYPDELDPESPLYRVSAAVETVTEHARRGPWDDVLELLYEGEEESFEYVQAFATLAQHAFSEYARRKRDEEMLDYGDLIALTNHFLNSLRPAARREIGFFAGGNDDSPLGAHVMVDEFQDTNPAQWAVIKGLTCEDPSNPEATNLFLVGDDKQSIYRFRGADVSVFGDAETELDRANQEAGIVDEQEPLTRNFRTLDAPVSAINGLFDRVFVSERAATQEDPWYAEYGGQPAPFEADSEPLQAAREDQAAIEPVVEYLPVPVDASLADRLLQSDDETTHDLLDGPTFDRAAMEADAVTNRLTKLLTDGTQVYEELEEDDPAYDQWDDGSDGPVERPRAVQPDDIAILLRTRSDLGAYERSLREAGVPYSVIKGGGFLEAPEIETLLNLLRVLVDPTDDRALYALLRSPMFGQPDDALAQLALRIQDEPEQSLWDALSAATESEWTAIHDDLTRFRGYAGQTDAEPAVESWGELLTRVYDQTGYLAAVAADERGEKAVANVERFRDRLRASGPEERQGLAELVATLEEQLENSDDPEANVISFDEPDSGTTTGSVDILTIHEAKGDEYPVVVVPGMARNFRQASDTQSGLGSQTMEFETVPDPTDEGRVPILGLKGPNPLDPYADSGTAARALARHQRRAEERAEEKRTLYVACTRARDHLILAGQHKQGDSEDDEPAVMEAPEPAEADAWRDWVQAVLLPDDDSSEDEDGRQETTAAIDPTAPLERLISAEQYDRTLPFKLRDGSERTGRITVRLPPEATDYQPGATEPTLNPDAYDPEPALTRETVLAISPSQCSRVLDGSGTLERTQAHRIEYHPGTNTGTDQGTAGPTSVPGGIPSRVFGTLVHRFCELQPPTDKHEQLIRDLLREAEQEGLLDTLPEDAALQSITEAVRTRMERVTDALDHIVDHGAVHAQYDEYRAEATFEAETPLGVDRVELAGEIDYLAATADTYYVIDYKTDRPGDRDHQEFVEEQATHHRPQLLAYAAMLAAHDPEREVRAALFFTEVDDPIHDFGTFEAPAAELFEALDGVTVAAEHTQ
ncbi:UvrD-helicase domain-containing protein [Haloglomus halophilum]|uniref:UvrD-helicase domain-containing protein n=1 Tax=Haloglomus halophilum TaxID=2962672 RepID=UPI0020C9CD91|nr:UvrD-helicase domain-containing protein [Haloglomus halophilum]